MILVKYFGPVGEAAATLSEAMKVALLDIHDRAPNFVGGTCPRPYLQGWGRSQVKALARRGLVTVHPMEWYGEGYRPTDLGSRVARGLIPVRARTRLNNPIRP